MPGSRLVVLASGNGSNLQAIIDACADGRLPAGSSPSSPTGPTPTPSCAPAQPACPPSTSGATPARPRADYDARLADVVAGFGPDLVVLAGWMRILTMSFLGWFPDRVVNLHPALPGELPGTHAIERAFARGARRRAHDHRRDGPPRPRRGRRRRSRCSARRPSRSTPTTPSSRSPPASTTPSTSCSSPPSPPSADRRSVNDVPQRRAVRPLRGPHVRRRGHRPRLLRDAARHRRHRGARSPPTSRSPCRSSRRRWTRSPRRAWRSPWPARAASASSTAT